jgi:hypothetical protein
MGSPKRRNNLVIEQRPVKPALLHQKQRPIGASILSLSRYVPYCTSSGLVWLGGFWEISGTQPRQRRNVRCSELSSSRLRGKTVACSCLTAGSVFFSGSLKAPIIIPALGLPVAKSEST